MLRLPVEAALSAGHAALGAYLRGMPVHVRTLRRELLCCLVYDDQRVVLLQRLMRELQADPDALDADGRVQLSYDGVLMQRDQPLGVYSLPDPSTREECVRVVDPRGMTRMAARR